MANDSRNDDFPTIRLDEEDRRDYDKKRHTAAHTIKPEGKSSTSSAPESGPAKTKRSGASILLVIIALLLALGSMGGCYYLYTLHQQQQVVALETESRIAELERKLSATDEEMGESTVALQVKVNELAEKSKELWEQMDKLWASAWRRNQKEITDLGAKVNTMQKDLKGSISTVADDVNTHQNRLSSMKSQQASLADEILALNVALEQVSNDKRSNQQTIQNVNDKLSVLEKRNSTLSTRISSMENEIRSIATKVISSPGGQAPPN